jgi:hypothetical protein
MAKLKNLHTCYLAGNMFEGEQHAAQQRDYSLSRSFMQRVSPQMAPRSKWNSSHRSPRPSNSQYEMKCPERMKCPTFHHIAVFLCRFKQAQ